MTNRNEQSRWASPAIAVGASCHTAGQVLSSAETVSHPAEVLRGEVLRYLGEVRAA